MKRIRRFFKRLFHKDFTYGYVKGEREKKIFEECFSTVEFYTVY